MFFKKIFISKNFIINYKKCESLCKVFWPAQRTCIKAFSCEPISSDIDVEMTVKTREGCKPITYKVKSVPNSQTAFGEAPHWNRLNDSLYYVDLNTGKLLRHDFPSNQIKKSQLRGVESATFVIPVDGYDNRLVVGSNRNIELVIWDGNTEKCCIFETLASVQSDTKFTGNRFNNGKCDEIGRLFAGTMHATGNEFEERRGELFMLKRDQLKTVLSGLGISNGLTWNKENNRFYFIDMADSNVKEFEFDKKSGDISNPKVVYDWSYITVPQYKMLPAGMTIDIDGNIYVAMFNLGTVYKIDPRESKILLEIKLPCRRVTSCAFGGPSMDVLYVTTAAKYDDPPPAGMLFQVTGLGSCGFPMNPFKLKC